jgi:hypothetical protein
MTCFLGVIKARRGKGLTGADTDSDGTVHRLRLDSTEEEEEEDMTHRLVNTEEEEEDTTQFRMHDLFPWGDQGEKG